MRKRVIVLLLLTVISTSAFADGVIGSGSRTEETTVTDERGIMGSGTRSIIGSGGLRHRIVFAFTQLLQLAEQRASGLMGSGS